MTALGAQKQTTRRARHFSALQLVPTWIAALVVVGGPIYLMIATASKPTAEAHSVDASLPTKFDLLHNISTVIDEGNTLSGLLNSVLITVPAVVLLLLFGSMAAWVFARVKSRATTALYFVAISGVMLPPAIVATIKLLSTLGLSGSRIGLILFYGGTQLSIAIFLMTGFVKAIPFEIEEAARIDGAGTWRIYRSIILPSLRPVLLTASIVLTLFIWNDFLTPFFLLSSPGEQTLPLGLYNFASANQYQLNWNFIFTQILLVSLPLLILYISAQRKIVGGLLGGSGK
jgi:raffinose/stachyose/melibiose transport system permease protein